MLPKYYVAKSTSNYVCQLSVARPVASPGDTGSASLFWHALWQAQETQGGSPTCTLAASVPLMAPPCSACCRLFSSLWASKISSFALASASPPASTQTSHYSQHICFIPLPMRQLFLQKSCCSYCVICFLYVPSSNFCHFCTASEFACKVQVLQLQQTQATSNTRCTSSSQLLS